MSKSSEQPIWLLVALMLALIVGLTMYKLVTKGVDPLNAWSNIPADENTRVTIENFCKNWIRPTELDDFGRLNPTASEPTMEKRTQISNYFRAYKWLSERSYDDAGTTRLVEPVVSGCDCIMLLVTSAGSRLLSSGKASNTMTSPQYASTTYASDACNCKAVCEASRTSEMVSLYTAMAPKGVQGVTGATNRLDECRKLIGC